MSDEREVTTGKLFYAANPWPLAAKARDAGYDASRFRESDIVADGKVIIVDLDAVNAALELRDPYGISGG